MGEFEPDFAVHEQSGEYAASLRRPYEVYGFEEQERLYWRVGEDRFLQILADDETLIHQVLNSSNQFGDFVFVTTSRPGDHGRVAMVFYGLGYHQQRERWILDEWYWYQGSVRPELLAKHTSQEEVFELLKDRKDRLQPRAAENKQTTRGRLFEILAELTDEDGALAKLEDLDNIGAVLSSLQIGRENNVPPTGKNLLDETSRETLLPLYSEEERGLDALAQVKFFTPDAQWTWYASEFDGEDIFFGLVVGLENELGYFSLKELQSVRGPLGLLIERDLHFEPKPLRDLMGERARPD